MSDAKIHIGYDTSSDAYDLSVICLECSDKHGDGRGTPLYAGEGWGGPLPKCRYCKNVMSGLEEEE